MEDIRRKMIREKEAILSQIVAKQHQTSSVVVDHDIGDDIDSSVEEQEREFLLLLQDRDRRKLEQLNDALRRMKSGEYGFCEECGEPITKKRLKVVPFTRMCVNCQNEQERTIGGGRFVESSDTTQYAISDE